MDEFEKSWNHSASNLRENFRSRKRAARAHKEFNVTLKIISESQRELRGHSCANFSMNTSFGARKLGIYLFWNMRYTISPEANDRTRNRSRKTLGAEITCLFSSISGMLSGRDRSIGALSQQVTGFLRRFSRNFVEAPHLAKRPDGDVGSGRRASNGFWPRVLGACG
jgi:hypothetical protein